MNPKINDTILKTFSFTQDDVIAFSNISGDKNPLHLDNTFAKKTIFKRPIIHGFLGGSVFSKILATHFWGNGTIYLSQTMNFKKPMFVDTNYIAQLTLEKINSKKNIAIITTNVFTTNNDPVITGEAVIKFN